MDDIIIVQWLSLLLTELVLSVGIATSDNLLFSMLVASAEGVCGGGGVIAVLKSKLLLLFVCLFWQENERENSSYRPMCRHCTLDTSGEHRTVIITRLLIKNNNNNNNTTFPWIETAVTKTFTIHWFDLEVFLLLYYVSACIIVCKAGGGGGGVCGNELSQCLFTNCWCNIASQFG